MQTTNHKNIRKEVFERIKSRIMVRDRFVACKALVQPRLEYISNMAIGASSRRHVAMNEDV